MHQPKQLQLFEIAVQPQIKAIYDPFWNELEAQTDDIVDEALFSIHAESETEIAHQQTINVGEQSSCDNSPHTNVGEQVKLDTKKVAHQHDKQVTHWVERYWVERGSSKLWYYRYTWMEGRKLHRHYIGSVRSLGAISKKQAVENAILDGQSPQEIKQLIRGLGVRS